MFSTFKNESSMRSQSKKTNTLPMTTGLGPEGPHRLTKSSTLPAVKSGRPEISRPILQAATPAAASLISKAPSTGVPQSSILSNHQKSERPPRERTSRAVAFCEPLTLPSPTNPNTPPIIHQPYANGMNSPTQIAQPTPIVSTIVTSTDTAPLSPTTATVITPTWSVFTLPKSDSVVCHVENLENEDDHLNEKIILGFSKIKSKLKQKRESKKMKDLSPTSSSSDRSRFRSLEISGPLLQTSLDSRLNLVPVSRAPGVEPLHFPQDYFFKSTLEENTGTFENPISAIHNPRLHELKDSDSFSSSKDSPTRSRRPNSIATSRPSRPTSKPPQPPPLSKTESGEPIYDVIVEPFTNNTKLDPIPPLLPLRPTSLLDSKEISSIGSSDSAVVSPQEEFHTPTSSPLFNKKSPDSMTNSFESEFLSEVIAEMSISGQDASIYSAIIDKKKKKQ